MAKSSASVIAATSTNNNGTLTYDQQSQGRLKGFKSVSRRFRNSLTESSNLKYVTTHGKKDKRARAFFDDDDDEKSHSGSDNDDDFEQYFIENILDDMLTGKQAYLEACRRFIPRLTPVSHLLDNIDREFINLKHNGIGDKGAVALAECLKVNSCIKSLDLSDNFINEEGGLALVEALGKNDTLTFLDLSSNRMGPRVGPPLSRAFRNNKCLQRVGLAGNRLGTHGASLCCAALEVNIALRHVDLSGNDLTPSIVPVISRMLLENFTLESLWLGWNTLRDSGAIALTHGLTTDNRVCSIHLPFCGLSSASGIAFANLLQRPKQPALTDLDLSHNRLGPDAAAALGASLQVNQRLRFLQLGHNPLEVEGDRALLEGLRGNTGLTELGLERATVGNVQQLIGLWDLAQSVIEAREQAWRDTLVPVNDSTTSSTQGSNPSPASASGSGGGGGGGGGGGRGGGATSPFGRAGAASKNERGGGPSDRKGNKKGGRGGDGGVESDQSRVEPGRQKNSGGGRSGSVVLNGAVRKGARVPPPLRISMERPEEVEVLQWRGSLPGVFSLTRNEPVGGGDFSSSSNMVAPGLLPKLVASPTTPTPSSKLLRNKG